MGPQGGMWHWCGAEGGFPLEKRSGIRFDHSFARLASIWAASPLHRIKMRPRSYMRHREDLSDG